MEQQLFEKCLEMEGRPEKDPNTRTQLRWTHGIYPSFGENTTSQRQSRHSKQEKVPKQGRKYKKTNIYYTH